MTSLALHDLDTTFPVLAAEQTSLLSWLCLLATCNLSIEVACHSMTCRTQLTAMTSLQVVLFLLTAYLVLQYPGAPFADQLHHSIVGGECEQGGLACRQYKTVALASNSCQEWDMCKHS